MDTFQQHLREAADHLQRADPLLAPTIERSGLPAFKPHSNYYRELVIAIISQQVSTKAADTIFKRLEDSFGGTLPDAPAMAATPIEHLREVGISGRKASYILDLAARASDGRLQLEAMPTLSDAEVEAELIAVKGIGQWTSDVFMIFCLGRPDIMAAGDLGIRAGVQKLLQLDTMPSPEEVIKISKQRHWHPYRSAACWYLWRSLEDNLYLYDKR